MSLDNKLDSFLSENMKASHECKAPENFMNRVMEQVQQYETDKSSIRYEPLISKKQWIIIFSVIGLLSIYALISGINLKTGILTYLNFNLTSISLWNGFNFNLTSLFFGFELHPSFSIGIVIIFFFILLNIIVIRKLFLR